jgi:hypothetical protein
MEIRSGASQTPARKLVQKLTDGLGCHSLPCTSTLRQGKTITCSANLYGRF